MRRRSPRFSSISLWIIARLGNSGVSSALWSHAFFAPRFFALSGLSLLMHHGSFSAPSFFHERTTRDESTLRELERLTQSLE